jgi:hypothetical protein
VDQTIAFSARDSIWQQFRKNFKYHIQTIGMTDINTDHSVTIVLSEPPPHVNVEDIKAQLKDYRIFVEEKINKVGYDGWLKDLLIVISGVNEKRLDKLVNKLNKYLYFSEYKPYSISLSERIAPNNFLGNLNFKINVSELEKWLFTDHTAFYFADDSLAVLDLNSALMRGKTGILYSKKPGFIVWLLWEGGSLTGSESEIRRFALDSDLILGAIRGGGGTIAIIGKERTTNLYDMPPLRTETVMMLASADKEQLSQSYERMSLFAGKMSGGMDWAPIYLSQELLNTEYGSLLNITDQMLKSWSMNGSVDYIDFSYPKPSYYSFPRSMWDIMNTSTLTFNWNTKGVGYTVDFGDNEYYCVNRTGSLPVTYIPEGLVPTNKAILDACEKRAYDYFSYLNNRDLVRVVQYASLYQIFSKYRIQSAYSQSNFKYSNVNDTGTDTVVSTVWYENPLKDHVIKLINEIKGFDDEKVEAIADKVVKDYPLESKHYLINYFFRMKDELDYSLELFDYDAENRFANIILNPRDFKPVTKDDSYKIIFASNFVKRLGKDWKYILDDSVAEKFRDEYVRGRSLLAGPWIKTPSVVVSWSSKDSAVWEGGHNLNAKVSRFRVSDEVARGEIKTLEVDGNKIFLISKDDISNIDPAILRNISVSENIPDHIYVRDKNYVARNFSDVFPDIDSRKGRGFSDNHIKIEKISEGFTINGKQVNDCQELVDELTSLSNSNQFNMLQVHFEKVNESQAKALLKSSEIKMAGTDLNQAKILRNGEYFSINRTKYDFGKAKVIGNMSEHEIVIEIPQINNVNSRARFSITGFLKEIKDKIVNSINKLIGRSTTENINFYEELIKELKIYNIRPENIIMEVDDCIICIKIYAIKNDNC